MSNKKKRNKERKEFNKDKDMVACPSCNAMVYPISSAVNEKGEPTEIICSSCKEDILPMIEAYKEYLSIRAKQKQEEQEAIREAAILEAANADHPFLPNAIMGTDKEVIEGEYSVIGMDYSNGESKSIAVSMDSEGNVLIPLNEEPGLHTSIVTTPKPRKPRTKRVT